MPVPHTQCSRGFSAHGRQVAPEATAAELMARDVARLNAEVAELTAQNAALKKEARELETELGQWKTKWFRQRSGASTVRSPLDKILGSLKRTGSVTASADALEVDEVDTAKPQTAPYSSNQ
jgi:hypothetical protein